MVVPWGVTAELWGNKAVRGFGWFLITAYKGVEEMPAAMLFGVTRVHHGYGTADLIACVLFCEFNHKRVCKRLVTLVACGISCEVQVSGVSHADVMQRVSSQKDHRPPRS